MTDTDKTLQEVARRLARTFEAAWPQLTGGR